MSSGFIARKTDRGYGFIKPDDGAKDLFFHAKDLAGVRFDDLQEGESERVTFDVAESPKGPNAVNIKRA
jgi:CspA family cold shock protein